MQPSVRSTVMSIAVPVALFLTSCWGEKRQHCGCQTIEFAIDSEIEIVRHYGGFADGKRRSLETPALLIRTTWRAVVSCDNAGGVPCEGTLKIESRTRELQLWDNEGEKINNAFAKSALEAFYEGGGAGEEIVYTGRCGRQKYLRFGIETFVVLQGGGDLDLIEAERQTLFALHAACGSATIERPLDIALGSAGIDFHKSDIDNDGLSPEEGDSDDFKADPLEANVSRKGDLP